MTDQNLDAELADLEAKYLAQKSAIESLTKVVEEKLQSVQKIEKK